MSQTIANTTDMSAKCTSTIGSKRSVEDTDTECRKFSRIDYNLDDKELIGFENGVYHLRKGKFLSNINPDDYTIRSVGYNYVDFSKNQDNLKIQTIETFMSQIFPDSELREYMWSLMAKFLIGYNPDKSIHIGIGRGSNGKSTLMRLLHATLGGHACIYDYSDLADDVHSWSRIPSTDIRFISSTPEGSTQPITDKSLVFKCKPRVFLEGNNLPRFYQTDISYMRRIRIIPFVSTFVDVPSESAHTFSRIPDMASKLIECKEAFMYLLLQKCKQEYRKRLPPLFYCPEAVTGLLGPEQKSIEDVKKFISKYIKHSKVHNISFPTSVYHKYCEWYQNTYTEYKNLYTKSLCKCLDDFVNIVSREMGVERTKIVEHNIRFSGWPGLYFSG